MGFEPHLDRRVHGTNRKPPPVLLPKTGRGTKEQTTVRTVYVIGQVGTSPPSKRSEHVYVHVNGM